MGIQEFSSGHTNFKMSDDRLSCRDVKEIVVYAGLEFTVECRQTHRDSSAYKYLKQ